MNDYKKVIGALDTLFEIDHKIIHYCITHEAPSAEEILEARAAAAVITEAGMYQFSPDSSDSEFFREISNFIKAAE